MDFNDEETNRGNFIAILQLMAKGDPLLHKHLLTAKRNAIYTSKTIQNEVIHIICFFGPGEIDKKYS